MVKANFKGKILTGLVAKRFIEVGLAKEIKEDAPVISTVKKAANAVVKATKFKKSAPKKKG